MTNKTQPEHEHANEESLVCPQPPECIDTKPEKISKKRPKRETPIRIYSVEDGLKRGMIEPLIEATKIVTPDFAEADLVAEFTQALLEPFKRDGINDYELRPSARKASGAIRKPHLPSLDDKNRLPSVIVRNREQAQQIAIKIVGWLAKNRSRLTCKVKLVFRMSKYHDLRRMLPDTETAWFDK